MTIISSSAAAATAAAPIYIFHVVGTDGVVVFMVLAHTRRRSPFLLC